MLCPEGTVAGVDVRGTAPATRETDLLDPVCMVQHVHAILLSGGSAFGLAAADGVMRWLEEQGHGFDVGVAKVPIVPTACLFDLPIGHADGRPDAAAGYAACAAATDEATPQGSVGAGTGATIGKILGFGRSTKGGLGCAARKISGGVVVAAMVVVNAFGHIIDPSSQTIIAGARKPTGGYVDTVEFAAGAMGNALRSALRANTTLGVVATNAALAKVDATKVAQMAHNGLGRTICPAHSQFDGDTIFALSCGDRDADVSLIGALAADVVGDAILAAVRTATALHGIPAAK